MRKDLEGQKEILRPVFSQNTGDRQIHIETYSIHDILRGDNNCPVTLNTLQFLVQSQASLHMASAKDDPERMKMLLKSKGNTLRGFVLYAKDLGPAAYAIYYPMIDSKGARVAYCEDFFIVESYRGHGVSKILFHELAKRTMQDNAEYLQWATDRRNIPVHNYVQQRLGAKHPNIITISANKLLAAKPRIDWDSKDLATRPLKVSDVDLPGRLNLSPNIIRNTGDLPFKGFVTFDRSRPNEPLAITPGWIHFSTFQLKEGLHLEQPIFANGVDKQNIISSVIQASRKHASANRLSHFRWHVEDDHDLRDILQKKLDLAVDSMIGTPESELIVYTLTNGNLNALAENIPSRILNISPDTPIGMQKERPKTDIFPEVRCA